MPDESPECLPPVATVVVRRAMALSALVCRGNIDNGKGNIHAESARTRMIAWIEGLKLTDQLAAQEWEHIRGPLGSLSEVVANRYAWQAEGLAVLAWALRRCELPKHDAKVDPFAVTEAVCFLADDAATFIAAATRRSDEELGAYRELMYAIHCRIRDFMRHGVPKDITHWIESEWLNTLQIDPSRVLADFDIAFGGRPISAWPRDRLQQFEWAIAEQHRASIWLMGEFEDYWETTADT